MLRLDELPPDLLLHITSFLRTHRDLLAICSTCTALYRAGLPRLYHEFVVSDKTPIRILGAALSSDNPGVHYIRHVSIRSLRLLWGDVPAHYLGHPFEETRADSRSLLQLLAYLLPRNKLRTLVCDARGDIPTDFFETLHARQRNLTTCCFNQSVARYRLSTGVRSWSARGTDGDLFSNIVHLQLEFGNGLSVSEKDSQYFRAAVRSCPVLKVLELRTLLPEASADTYREKSEQIFALLFGAWTLPQLRLRALRIRGFELSAACELMFPAIDLKHLSTLELRECKDPLSLLLSASPSIDDETLLLPNLRHLAVTIQDEAELGDPASISNLLQHLSLLETLVLQAPRDHTIMPSIDCLLPSSKTLRMLYLDCYDDSEGYESFEFENQLEEFIALREFAVSCPSWIARIPWSKHDELKAFCHVIEKAPLLRYVQFLCLPVGEAGLNESIFTDPTKPIHVVDDEAKATFLQGNFREFATAAFNFIPQIRTIAMGSKARAFLTKNENVADAKYFHRGIVTDWKGVTSAVALDTSATEVRSVEPYSTICEIDPLSFGFLRMDEVV
ncbi:hypothetical protein K431DRAFT_349883 [Polychaeton citri CBS 116435]|uniref:F-box domain-containing protein n=1 Tax=Polychaeton citri CBS 116435 TaxID=1314669 RepID=A0A9P4PY10_9PEZI|nr:hypothetical protein K431DRAFT_349883 [Polychaeton citri CBS 116435]